MKVHTTTSIECTAGSRRPRSFRTADRLTTATIKDTVKKWMCKFVPIL